MLVLEVKKKRIKRARNPFVDNEIKTDVFAILSTSLFSEHGRCM